MKVRREVKRVGNDAESTTGVSPHGRLCLPKEFLGPAILRVATSRDPLEERVCLSRCSILLYSICIEIS
jgi:hypothetical protein